MANQPYRVLARKYRPTDFTGLIGQEALVRTLSNAFATGRIAHAFMLTGVRGVGKTTTARIIARALNCIGPDGKQPAPTIHPCGQCEPCVSISESRNVDVQEMDAASRTGIDDIREIIEGVRYAPVAARYKVYIIDEVHMLSKQAFNGLLKTLEEPPPHVKFVFATTEIRKVPVTVLSRCQRFDLRRIDSAELAAYLATLAEKENVKIEEDALALIARAAEGSARDSLSLLDQAIAHGEGEMITAETVRQMLGLADRGRVLDIFEKLMGGKLSEALTDLSGLYDAGADPLAVMQDLLETTHFLTRVKVAPAAQGFFDGGSGEAKRAADLAAKLSVASLTRAWQILLKGLFEVRDATRPISACEMALIRLAHAAELPPTDKLVKDLLDGGAIVAAVRPRRRLRLVHRSPQAPPCPRARRCPKAPPRRVSAIWKILWRWPPRMARPSCAWRWKTTCIWCIWSRAASNFVRIRARRALWRAICSRNCATGPANAGPFPSPARAARPPCPSRNSRPRRRALKQWHRSRWCARCWTGFPARKSWRCATSWRPKSPRPCLKAIPTPDGGYRV